MLGQLGSFTKSGSVPEGTRRDQKGNRRRPTATNISCCFISDISASFLFRIWFNTESLFVTATEIVTATVFQGGFRAFFTFVGIELLSFLSWDLGWLVPSIPSIWQSFRCRFAVVSQWPSHQFRRFYDSQLPFRARRNDGEKGQFLLCFVLLATVAASANSSTASLPADIRWKPLSHPAHQTRKQLENPQVSVIIKAYTVQTFGTDFVFFLSFFSILVDCDLKIWKNLDFIPLITFPSFGC